jgi:hypothetical protein
VTDDHDLRADLERLASSVGDPPEHGLDRVAARRHRRQRRRRGAVATATVLAVLSAAAVSFTQRPDRRDTVTRSDQVGPVVEPPELPRVVQVLCTPGGIEVPVASVRAESDGLHIEVTNALGESTTLHVDGGGWSSGEIEVPVGTSTVRQPVPPGQLTVGCGIGGRVERRRVDLADTGGYYRIPELACPRRDVVTLEELPVQDEDADSIVAAARGAVEPLLVPSSDGFGVSAVRGYQSQRLSDPTADPEVQVTNEGEVVAFVHVRGEDGATSAPWVVVAEAEVCARALAEPPAEFESDDEDAAEPGDGTEDATAEAGSGGDGAAEASDDATGDDDQP